MGQKDQSFKASLGYKVKPNKNKTTTKGRRTEGGKEERKRRFSF